VKNNVRYKKRLRRSRVRRRLAFAALITVFAIALAFALRPRTHATPIHLDSTTRNVSIVHRAHATPWGQDAREDLKRAVHEALAPAVHDARAWSCIILAQDGSVLYEDHAATAVTPASVLKLIVTDAALTSLGPTFHYDTILAATQPSKAGLLNGNLWLAGSGDPSFRSEDLAAAIPALRAAGIESVNGGVVVDGSALAGEEINPFWNADDGNEDFMAATSGISIDEDTVEFDVTGTVPGQAAQIAIRPQSDKVRYYGSVTTGAADDVIVAATQAPNQFRLAGTVPPAVREKFWVPVHGIPQYAGSVVQAVLKRAQIQIARPPQTGTVPLDARVLWMHRSKPLPELLKHMLTFSDNHYAEQLMRTVGARSGNAADDGAGLQAERHVLTAQAIPTPGLRVLDGSGLAHGNRVAAITIARILAHFDADPRGNILYPLLARGGLDGTLKMYRFTTAAGRVRAKSGHLEDAASLAGYVESRRHGRIVFAFMINGSPGDPDSAIVAAVDRLSER
jgi:serine-type D-Ala-D-Ala carboxypeptidase/endopeptidase (penicillin-binding protein 4)